MTTASPETNPEHRVKILAIDDRPDNLIALEGALRRCNYEIIKANSGAEGLELLQKHEYAVVLLDVQMPGMDGFETARRMRKSESGKRTPIIFMTAIHRSSEFEQLGYVAGAVDYLFKPINTDILIAKLNVFAELQRRNEENQRQANLLKEAALKEQENALLKKALAIRDEFLSMAAHELKTPITPLNLQLQIFLQLYRDGTIDKVERERLIRMLQISQDQVTRLARLINELLDVSQIRTGRLELKPESVDLRAVVEGIVSAFAEEAARAECQVSLHAPASVIGQWDRFRIEQVAINLLTNAFKYGPGKPIQISVAEEGGRAVLAVQDQGLGIDSKDHARIFERFERAVSPENYGGLGLGLYIASQIVNFHGGSIKVESELHHGAKFIVELPV